jgi:hypothetical protein
LGDETLATLLNKAFDNREKEEQRERTHDWDPSTKTQGGPRRVHCFDASTVITYTQSFPLLRFFYQYMLCENFFFVFGYVYVTFNKSFHNYGFVLINWMLSLLFFLIAPCLVLDGYYFNGLCKCHHIMQYVLALLTTARYDTFILDVKSMLNVNLGGTQCYVDDSLMLV